MSIATATKNASHGEIRSFFTESFGGRGATVSINRTTNVVVLRKGEWVDDCLVTRGKSSDEAERAFSGYVDRLVKEGYDCVKTRVTSPR